MSKVNIAQRKQQALSLAQKNPRLAAQLAAQAGTTLDQIRTELEAPQGAFSQTPVSQLQSNIPIASAPGIALTANTGPTAAPAAPGGFQASQGIAPQQQPSRTPVDAAAVQRQAREQRAALRAQAAQQEYVQSEPTVSNEGQTNPDQAYSLQLPQTPTADPQNAQASFAQPLQTFSGDASAVPTGTTSPVQQQNALTGGGQEFAFSESATNREGRTLTRGEQEQSYLETLAVETDLARGSTEAEPGRARDFSGQWNDQTDIEESLNIPLASLASKDNNTNLFAKTLKDAGDGLSSITWGTDVGDAASIQDSIRAYYGTASLGEVNNAATLAIAKVFQSVNTEAELETRITKEGGQFQTEDVLNLTGSTVNEAVALLDQTIKGLIKSEEGNLGDLRDTDLAPKVLLQNFIDAGLFITNVDLKTSELRLLATEELSSFYGAINAINDNVFQSTPSRTSKTPLLRKKGSLPNYVGDLKGARKGSVIERANTDIPAQVIAFGETLTATKNFADPDAVRLLEFARTSSADMSAEIAELRKASEVARTPQEKAQIDAIIGNGVKAKEALENSLKVTSDDEVGFSIDSLTGEVRADGKAGYADATIDALKEAAGDGLPRYNRYRVDPTSYRLYIDGGEFLVQGNLISRNTATGAKMTNTFGDSTTAAHVASAAFKDGGPLIPAKDWKALESAFEGKGTLDEKWMTGNRKFQIHLWGLANNLVKGSRALSHSETIANLTPELLREAQQKYLTIEAVVDPAGAAARVAKNAEARRIGGNTNAEWKATEQNPNQQLAAEALLPDLIGDGKEWGNKLRAWKAASNLVDAMTSIAPDGSVITRPKTSWSHFLSVEMDMISAGRMFAAAQSGNVDVLKRGAYAASESYNDDVGFLQPDGSPRTDFMERLVNMTELPESFRSSATEAEKSNVKKFIAVLKNHRKNLQLKLRGHIDNNTSLTKKEKDLAHATLKAGLHSELKSFDDFFAKSPLLTTDYGETPWSKRAAAKSIIKKLGSKHPKLSGELSDVFGPDLQKSFDTINDVLVAGTLSAVDIWQGTVPKTLTRALGMLNILPQGKGLFGETLAIGQMGFKPKLDKESITITDIAGNKTVLTPAGKAADPHARGAVKITSRAVVAKNAARTILAYIDPDTEIVYAVDESGAKTNKQIATREEFEKITKGDKKLAKKLFPDTAIDVIATSYFDPGYGTAAGNAIGPAFGQADETNFFVVLDQLIAKKAPWIHNQPEFFQAYVFDNIRADPATAFVMSKLAKEAMEVVISHNKPADFVDTNFARLKTAMQQLRKRGKVDIGLGSEFEGVTRTLDQMAIDYKNNLAIGKGNPAKGIAPDPSALKKANRMGATLKIAAESNLWRPTVGLAGGGAFTIEFTTHSGNKRSVSVKARGHDLDHYTVEASTVANFIEDHFASKLLRIDPKTKRRQIDLFRDLANTKKPEAQKALRENASIFFDAGLD